MKQIISTEEKTTASSKDFDEEKKNNYPSFEPQDDYMKEMAAQMRPWLDKIDKVREVLGQGNQVDIELPTIVVIGDQSSGKSSVLESISKVELPKGAGCVTKCPLIMQLRNTDGREYADIRTSKQPIEEATEIDMSKIHEYIKTKSNELTGDDEKSKSNIVSDEIFLRIYKKDYIDLTLVDLPGITYEKKDLAEKIKSIYQLYISNENSIILYVAAAVSDLTTGESLALARSVDPEIKRTLTIVTKIDRRDPLVFRKQLEDVSDGLGAVCVRNRTQEEVEKKIPFEDVLEKESEILAEKDLASMPDNFKGIPMLVQ